MPDPPIACTLDPAALRARREGLLAELLGIALERELVPGGYRIRFAPADHTLALIGRAIDAERRCCRFLRFQITVEPDGGPILLELSGPGGTQEFLTALLEP